MRPTVPLLKAWKFQTVEWNPKVSRIKSQLNATHFVLPDLPAVYSPSDRDHYFSEIPPSQRIVAVATCRQSPETLRDKYCRNSNNEEVKHQIDKLLLVGGNEKTPKSLSVVEAASIFKEQQSTTTLWGVTNPNDPKSIERVERKIAAGITGFLTQPFLSSNAIDIFEAYPRQQHDGNITYIAGLAMPKTARSLQFWCDLLEQPELRQDPLFKAHLAFFSAQPHYSSYQWIGKEMVTLATCTTMDGIHFMPLTNTEDLVALFQLPALKN